MKVMDTGQQVVYVNKWAGIWQKEIQIDSKTYVS